MDTIKRGGGVPQFMAKIAERARSLPLQATADRMLGFESARDGLGYSISRALHAAMERSWDDAGLEREVSDLSQTKTGKVPNGFFVPLGILSRDFNAGTASEAGNLIGSVVDRRADGDPLRKVSALAGMGATFLTGLSATVSLPRFTSSSSAAWGSEVAAAGEVFEETTSIELTPKRCPVTMVLSRQALIQGGESLDIAISRHLIAAVMETVERDALNGDGTSNAPVGLRSTSGIGSVVGGTDGALLTFAHLCDLEDKPAAANCRENEFSGFIVNSATRRYLRTTARGTGLDYIWDGGARPLLGHRAAVTNLMPSDLEKGASGAVCSSLLYASDWSQFLVGMYGGGVDVTVDRVTLAATGKVRITAAALVGVGSIHPQHFASMDDAKTA
jgi:HK97 family phage major capsid protein